MSGLTAKNFGLANRGTIATGHHADIVVFDATTVIDKATYDTPTEPAEGIATVIVNGALTWHKGVHRGARHGHVAHHRHQDVVEVVRDASGELPDGFHLLRLAQLILQAFLHGHIAEEAQ